MPQPTDCNWLSSTELAAGAAAGQGALTPVKQMFSSKVLAPAAARFLISKPLLEVWSTATCTGALPTMMFPRMMLPWTPAVRNIPFTFPTISLSSIVLSVSEGVTKPIPKLLPCAANPFPLTRFSRSRLWLAPPASHMPPQGLLTLPFRIEILPSNWFREDPPVTKIPEAQFVDVVTPVTLAPMAPFSTMP